MIRHSVIFNERKTRETDGKHSCQTLCLKLIYFSFQLIKSLKNLEYASIQNGHVFSFLYKNVCPLAFEAVLLKGYLSVSSNAFLHVLD